MSQFPSFPKLHNLAEIESPALLFVEECIEANIRRMLALVGGDANRLRPHVKTHKTPEIIAMQLREGVTRFKAATLAEAEMCAAMGASDVLLAYPLQGPAIGHLVELRREYPKTLFSMLVDSSEFMLPAEVCPALVKTPLDVFLDVDCGMGRTGIEPDARAVALYQHLCSSPQLRVRGVHAYDGHLHDPALSSRHEACMEAFAPVLGLVRELGAMGLTVPALVAGGSPTFGIHAATPGRECSPGTTVLWDFGYGEKFPDLPFECAAFLLTRVVSKPRGDRLCLDLGHKAVAPEMAQPRVFLQGLEDARVLMQSEEHLVLETPRASEFALGATVLGIPRHVCPSVSMHNTAIPFRNGVPGRPWKIAARGRQYLA